MHSLFRKLTAAVRNALTWGVAWAALGALPGLALALLPGGPPSLRIIAVTMLGCGAAGCAAGGLFSLILSTVYRNHRLSELRPARVGAWSMAAAMVLAYGLVLVLPIGDVAPPVGILAVVGAGALGWGAAAGGVRLAQAAERGQIGG